MQKAGECATILPTPAFQHRRFIMEHEPLYQARNAGLLQVTIS